MSAERPDSRPSSLGLPGLRIDPRSVSLRFVAVAALIAVSMIPLALVSCVAEDRERYRNVAIEDIAAAWGGQQRVAGPVMVIPIDGGESEDGVEHYVAVMPERVDVSITSRHEFRRRGIFETPVFTADLIAEGTFAPLDVEQLRARYGALRLDLASLAIGVSDPRGIRDAKLVWGEGEVALSAASGHGLGPIRGGLVGALADKAAHGGAFSLQDGPARYGTLLGGTGRRCFNGCDAIHLAASEFRWRLASRHPRDRPRRLRRFLDRPRSGAGVP